MVAHVSMAPGQFYAKRFAIYSALGVLRIKLETWRLSIRGLVGNELSLSFEELQRLPQVKLMRDFHCVTQWSIKDVAWEGVRLRELARLAKARSEARRVMFHCADGCRAPVPLKDAMAEDSIIASKMNDQPIPVEQRFPARPFIPHLYVWKSAKWLTKIEFIENCEDGYCEARGYHERGSISKEEQLKERKTRLTNPQAGVFLTVCHQLSEIGLFLRREIRKNRPSVLPISNDSRGNPGTPLLVPIEAEELFTP
jgi:DMSO/TMAO reductase YedYZ molybdopterin-dependent catalytic subunit